VAGKSYPVLRPFRWADPKTGADTNYDPEGDNKTFSGEVTEEMTSPEGPDGKGPLLGDEEKSDKASGSTAAASTSKEK
jgi:hypothetical protein